MTIHPRWRKSSFSASNGSCVELADLDEAVLVRNSVHPDRGTISFSLNAMAAFVAGCARGDYDDLSG